MWSTSATLMTVIVRNTGTETWPAFGPIRLAFEGSRSGARYAPHSAGDRMLLYADVAAGDTYTFQFWATPAQSDTVEHVGMVYDRWIVGMKKIDLYVACGTTECIDRSSLIDIASALR